MRASVSAFDERLSAMRASRTRADALWCTWEGVAANDRSPDHAEKEDALLRDIDAAERELHEATMAAWCDTQGSRRALRQATQGLYAVLILLGADMLRLWSLWLRR